MIRSDDTINVVGLGMSTCAMEEVLVGHPDVAECTVIGLSDALKVQLPLSFVVLTGGGVTSSHNPLQKEYARYDKEDCRRRRVSKFGQVRRPGDTPRH